ncbi:hypothetical protein FFLO_01049 [Filobasidium floriforme]|uniref:Transferase n=1 Tax=Filobasidium floriforme TaxID=5210 RepID=A0A8K0NQC4_9TREE|nr:hypothetical protein FFLO_01049 [Filobasidium floriforme]
MSEFKTTTTSSHVVRPSPGDPNWPQEIKDVPLSILDNTCAKFARSCATWIFNPPSDPSHFSEPNLLASFRQVTSLYSFWAGQLHWTDYDPSKGYQYRSGRLALTYGGDEVDIEEYPGFPIEFVETETRLSSILPTSTSTTNSASQVLLPSTWLIPSQEVALQDSYTLLGLPNLAVQVTKFACGAVGVGVKMTHSLADATTLVGFMHDWAKVHSRLAGKDEDKEEKGKGEKQGDTIPEVSFDPSLLDSKASGDLSSPTGPDASILSLSRSLPLHRYDWLNSGGGDCPPWFEPITACPPGVDLADDHDRARGERMPWGEWDVLKPVRHTIFRFSAEEVDGIWKAATDATTTTKSTDGQEEQQEAQPVKLSRLDTLLAHIWKAVMRANQIQPDEQSFLDMTFGLRTRLDLPARFLGSPLRQIAVPGNPSLSSSSLSRSIRSTLQRLDDQKACSALLHDLAYDTTGQNIWATFLGRRHLLCTSWTRLGVYDVDFGCGSKPEYVDAFMPASDGLLQIMEARPSSTTAGTVCGKGAEEGQGGSPWWKDGASVSLHLAEETMARLIADEAFREFA